MPFDSPALYPVNFYFDTDNILDKLTHLNIYKSPRSDRFHPRVLFEIRHEIVVPLQILYTASFCTGKLPSDWRSANITAVYKKVIKITLKLQINKSNYSSLSSAK